MISFAIFSAWSVIENEILGYVHGNDINKTKEVVNKINEVIKINKQQPSKIPTIIKIIIN